MRYRKIKQIRRHRRKVGIRKRTFGTPERPRLTVYRSLKHIYAQVVDDLAGKTLIAASSIKATGGGNRSGAEAVGKDIAAKAKAARIKKVTFDRNGFKFHGRIKALADVARKEGLQF